MAKARQLRYNLIRTLVSITLINFLIVDADFGEVEPPAPGNDVDEFLSRSGRSAAGSLSVKTAADGYRSRDHVGWITGDEGDIEEEKAMLTQRLLVGIERILDLFAGYTDELLVDALLGVKISNDQLNATLHQIAQRDSEMVSTISRLLHKGLEIMQISLTPDTCKISGLRRVGGVLYLTFDWRGLRHPSRSPFQYGVRMRSMSAVNHQYWNESISDYCISQLLHGKRPSSAQPTRCVVDDICVEILLRRCHGYALTHQLLYLMIGMKSGCTQQLNAKLLEMAPSDEQQQPTTIDSILDSYCKDIYKESIIINILEFPLEDRDLFIEQVTVCGLLNYVDFFRLDWAERILSWQQSDGCYHEIDTTHDGQARVVHATDTSNTHHREKRRDLVLKDGCSSHTTALATAYFSVLLRHITQPF